MKTTTILLAISAPLSVHAGSSSIDQDSIGSSYDAGSVDRRRTRADIWGDRFQPALCGDGDCDRIEDATSCPSDCTDTRLKTADEGGDKGSRGHMFTVQSSRDVMITNVDFYSRSIRSDQLVEVYTRVGGYSGYEFAEEEWEMVYNNRLDLQGRSLPTSVEGLSVYIPADTLQSFFLFTPNKVRYSEGSSEGSVFTTDGIIKIYEGVGVRRKFNGEYAVDIYTPRAFTGSIGYEVHSTTDLATDGPTQSPMVQRNDTAPTKSPSNSPAALTLSPTSSPSSAPSKTPTSSPATGGNTTFSDGDTTQPTPNQIANRPTGTPTSSPSASPAEPTNNPTYSPSKSPTLNPATASPSQAPSSKPTAPPSPAPTTGRPTRLPTKQPSKQPTTQPSMKPTKSPTPRNVKKISFVAFGDTPYTKDQRYCLNKQLRELDQEAMDFKFMAHVGDIKWGKTQCYESSFSDIAEMFSHQRNALNYDTRDVFFIPGDNEWMDCQDPDKAWRWWMKYFGNGKRQTTGILANENGFGTLADPNISVEYSGGLDNDFYPTTAANFEFFSSNTLFVGVNQIGGGRYGDESTRVHNNYKWVESNMAKYQPQGMRALVVFAHATMTSSRRQYFGDPFMKLLRQEYPTIKALYVHGDGHNFEVVQIDANNPNLIQLEVDGGEEADPLLISVVHDTVDDEYSFNIDVRGGYYYNGCQTGNTDKTWSSNY